MFEPYVCRLEVDFGVEFLSESECKDRGVVFYFQIFGEVFLIINASSGMFYLFLLPTSFVYQLNKLVVKRIRCQKLFER